MEPTCCNIQNVTACVLRFYQFYLNKLQLAAEYSTVKGCRQQILNSSLYICNIYWKIMHFVIVAILTKGLVINYGEGGYKMGRLGVGNLLRPPSRQGKTFWVPSTFQEWKLCVPPSAWPKHFPPPPLFVGEKLHMPLPLVL